MNYEEACNSCLLPTLAIAMVSTVTIAGCNGSDNTVVGDVTSLDAGCDAVSACDLAQPDTPEEADTSHVDPGQAEDTHDNAGETAADGLNALGCRNTFRVAMVLMDREDAKATQDDLARVESLKPLFEKRFEWATRGLATVQFAPGVVLVSTQPTGIDFVAVSREVISERGDVFEFLFTFDTFTEIGPSTFTPVRIDTIGTGRELLDFSKDYGSNGVLLGITHLRSIRLFDLSSQDHVEMHLNAMLHEMVHCWSSYVDYIDESGNRSNDLRNPMGGFIHWSKFILAGNPASVMGGLLWEEVGDGAWLASWEPKEGLIPLDLYLMGLIGPDDVPPVGLIVTETPPEEVNPGVVVHGALKTVTIEQVIAANGVVSCLVGQQFQSVR